MMKLRFNISEYSIQRVFFTYIVILILPLFVTLIVFSISYKRLEAFTAENTQLVLEQSRQFFSQRLDELDSMGVQLTQSTAVISFSYYRDSLLTGSMPAKAYVLKNQLPRFSISNDFISNYFLFFPRSNIVINDKIIYKTDCFIRAYFNENDNTDNEFYRVLCSLNVNNDISNKRYLTTEDNNIYYDRISRLLIYIAPIGGLGTVRASAVFVVEADKINDVFLPLIQSEDDLCGIINADGVLLARFGNERLSDQQLSSLYDHLFNAGQKTSYSTTIGANKYLISYVSDSARNITYFSMKPYRSIMRDLILLKILSYMLVGLSIIFGFIMALKFSRQNVSLMDLFAFRNKELNRTIEQQKPVMQTAFYERLLNGNMDAHQIEAISSVLDLSNTYNSFCVFIIQFFGHEWSIGALENEKLRLALSVKNCFANYIYNLAGSGNDKQVFILGYSHDNSNYVSEINESIQLLEQQYRPSAPCSMVYSIGRIYTGLQKLDLSYKDALLALNYKDVNKDRQVVTVLENKLPVENHASIYAFTDKLQSSIRSGDVSSVQKVFADMYYLIINSNLANDNNKMYALSFLTINMIRSTVIYHLSEAPDIFDNLALLSRNIFHMAYIDGFRQMEHICIQICAHINKRESDNRHMRIVAKIKEYIQENFDNPDMSLCMVAQAFGLSETYLSQQFKEYADENISTYLQNIRLNKAAEILLAGDDPVRLVAVKAGYAVVNTFEKAFKRKFGTSPAFYRENQRVNLNTSTSRASPADGLKSIQDVHE